MHLSSVRDLKAELMQKHLEPLLARAQGLPALGVAARAVKQLEKVPRTFAMGISAKGANDFRLAVRLQNRIFEGSPQMDAILKMAKGEADVRYVGRVVKRQVWHQSRQRPLLPGVSVGHFRITAGTLGCFVKSRTGGREFILSNNHVLADENFGRRGDAVIQPGRYDRGIRGRDTIGALWNFVRLSRSRFNRVDAAVASIRIGIEYDPRTLRGLGCVEGLGAPIAGTGDEVAKVGRTTGKTLGRVTAFELDNVVVAYDIGNLRFDDQIEIEGAESGPFSQGGDSGSLIVNAERKGVALLFAGGDQGGSNGQGLTYANPLHRVLDAFRVDLVA